MDNRSNDTIDKILKDRFTHSTSNIIYDTIATLWHIDNESEQLVSRIASKVVIGLFCLEYLSHLHNIIKENAGIKNQLTSYDLTNNDIMNEIKNRIQGAAQKGNLIEKHIKGIITSLLEVLEQASIKNLDELTKVAHLGDYLLSSLKDMKGVEDDYNLWLYSIPHYYKKDLLEIVNCNQEKQQKKERILKRSGSRYKKDTLKQI